jgi:hypothetical protein
MAKKKQQHDLPVSRVTTEQPDDSKAWAVFSLVSALAGATVAKKVLTTSWKAATGKEPPANPADPDVRMGEAVAWATVSGTAVALARMLASRRAANYFVRSTGHLPGQLAADGNQVKSKKNNKKAKKKK